MSTALSSVASAMEAEPLMSAGLTPDNEKALLATKYFAGTHPQSSLLTDTNLIHIGKRRASYACYTTIFSPLISRWRSSGEKVARSLQNWCTS